MTIRNAAQEAASMTSGKNKQRSRAKSNDIVPE